MADKIAIRVVDIHKSFKLPHEKQSSIKGVVVNVFNRNRSFEQQHVLKGISFDVKQGEFFGIVGRNGSGKSTLLKLLAGIYTPDHGTITVNGGLTPFIELGVGFNPELTGRENVYLNGALLGFNRKDMDGMYDEIVNFAELEKFMDQKLKNYSSGMQVRLAFSIAIRAKSDILVLDEVLAVGDEAFQRKCRDYFRDIKNSKQTVVLVTHDMKAVTDYCDRAMLVSDGELKMIDSPRVVSEAYHNLNNEVFSGESGAVPVSEDSIEAEARVSKIVARDPETGKAKRFFKPGEDIEVEVHYKLSQDINGGVIDLGFSLGKSGAYHFYTDSTSLNQKKVTGKAGETVKITCRVRNSFLPGTFYVATSFYDQDNSHVYARSRNDYTFSTGEPEVSGAIFYPQHVLKIQKGS